MPTGSYLGEPTGAPKYLELLQRRRGTPPAPQPGTMDTRRARLKELAARSARLWGLMPLPDGLVGETRVETRNTVYRFRNGVCYSVNREEQAGRKDPQAFMGMRLVGWLWRDDPRSVLSLEWQPGAYAVLWRPGSAQGDRSAVALTSPSIAFRQVAQP